MKAPHLYHLTARRPDSISGVAICSFSPGVESLVVSRGSFLELYNVNDESQLELKARTNSFAVIRCLNGIRIPGLGSDRLLVTSDSGCLAVLDFDPLKGMFSQYSAIRIAPEKLRREFPGEYLAVDPRGRIAMVAGLSNLRSVVLLQDRGAQPLAVEVPMPSVFCYSVIALDYGYENPRFAFLERFRFGSKVLTLYEFNLGLNRLMKEWSREVPDECDLIVGLPATRNGPLGLLTFAGSTVYHFDRSGEIASQTDLGSSALSANIIKSGANSFFVLACLRTRECKKIWLDDTLLDSASIEIDPPLSSIPSSVAVLKSGYIFVAASSGNHKLYEISNIDPLRLLEACELVSLTPVLSSLVTNRKVLIGSGTSPETSQISLAQFGVGTDTLASTQLPGKPRAVFTLKRQMKDDSDGLIVIAFDNSTVTLAIGDDGAVEEVAETSTGIASNIDTLGISGLVGGIAQVHSKGLRYISSEGGRQKISPWLVPANAKVVSCAFSPSQLALALSNRSIIYFEEKDGSLHESQHRLEVSSSICAISFFSSHAGELKSSHLLVALEDKTLRQYSAPKLRQQKLYNLSYLPTSVVHCLDDRVGPYAGSIYVGQANGTVSELKDDEMILRIIGSSPTKLTKVSEKCVLALSSQTWLMKNGTGLPLLGPAAQGLIACHKFSSEAGDDSQVIGVNKSELVVLSLITDHEKSTTHISAKQSLVSASIPLNIVKNSSSDHLYITPKAGRLSIVDNSLDTLGQTLSSCESPTATTSVRFGTQNREFLAIASETKIAIFDYNNDKENVSLVHETQVGAECYALLPFRGKLLAGVSNKLILYDIGQKQLLQQDGLLLDDLSSIRALRASQNQVFVGDTRKSVTVLKYDAEGFRVVGVDPVPRAVSKMVLLDAGSVCIGDQYGNLTLLHYASEAADTCTSVNTEQNIGLVQELAHYWVPDAILGLFRSNLSTASASEVIIYIGITGTIGVLIPFLSKSECNFFVELETYVTKMAPLPLLGGQVSQISGYYSPKKNVVNGDLCEYLVSAYATDLLQEAANELERTHADIFKRVESIKNRGVARESLYVT